MIIRASHLTDIRMLVLHYCVLLKDIHDHLTGINSKDLIEVLTKTLSQHSEYFRITNELNREYFIVIFKNPWATKHPHSPRMRTVRRILGLLPRALPFYAQPKRSLSQCLGTFLRDIIDRPNRLEFGIFKRNFSSIYYCYSTSFKPIIEPGGYKAPTLAMYGFQEVHF